MAAPRDGSRLVLQGGGELRTRRLPGGHETEHEAGGQGHQKGEEKHPGVGGAAQAAARLLERQGSEQSVADPRREQKAESAAQTGEEKALDQELAHDVAAPGAEGQAHRDLAFARSGSGQQQVRDVGAGDEQDESDHPRENEERGRELLPQRREAAKAREHLELLGQEAIAKARGRVGHLAELVLVDLTVEHLQARRRLHPRHAGLEPGHHVQPHEAPILELVPGGRDGRLHGQGDVEIGRRTHLDPVKRRSRHAHDRERAAVQLEDLPHHARIATEAPLPVAVVEHRHRAGVGLNVVFGGEGAAHGRLHPQHGEEVAGHDLSQRALGLPLGLEAQGHRKARQHSREDRVLVAEVAVHRVGKGLIGEEGAHVGTGAVEQHQLLGASDGQEAQEDLIEEGEDRRVGADAEAQRGHHEKAEARVLAEHPERVAQVLDDSFHESSPAPRSRGPCQAGATSKAQAVKTLTRAVFAWSVRS